MVAVVRPFGVIIRAVTTRSAQFVLLSAQRSGPGDAAPDAGDRGEGRFPLIEVAGGDPE